MEKRKKIIMIQLDWNVEIFKLDEKACVPTRNIKTDAGLDLYALNDVFIPYETTVKVATGVAIKIPNGFMGKVFSRSSVACKGLSVDAGVIDPGFAGEICVVIHNLTHPHDHDFTYQSGYHIKRGDKIAQLVIMSIETPNPVVVNKLWSSDRGSLAFGSSGK
jgi:dUTP pyrophosphatase